MAQVEKEFSPVEDDLDGVEVKESLLSNAGSGLFALKRFNVGEIVCEYRGKTLVMKEALQLSNKAYLMRLGNGIYVDASDSMEVMARYINDCRSKNVHNVIFEKLPIQGKAIVRATRDIHPGDEIYANYGKMYWLAHNLSNPNNKIK